MQFARNILIASIVVVCGTAISADKQAGMALSATCVTCHGQDGNSVVPGTPHLAGQNSRYLKRQMELIQSGTRPVPLMTGMLDGLNEQGLADIAAYYASLPASIREASRDRLEQGEAIYRGGIMEKGVAPCTACHSPNGSGNQLAGFPKVSGQAVEYTISQLTAYREGQRETDAEYGGMMRSVAANLTDNEIRAVANYMLGLN